MKIRMLTARAGVNISDNVGDEIDVPEAEAIRMIEAGQAEPVREAKAPEKAARKPSAEKAKK